MSNKLFINTGFGNSVARSDITVVVQFNSALINRLNTDNIRPTEHTENTEKKQDIIIKILCFSQILCLSVSSDEVGSILNTRGK